MMSFIEVPATCGVVFYFIYLVFDLFVRRKERLMVLEKMGQGFNVSEIKSYLPQIANFKSFTALKIGCLMMGIGVGLLIGLFVYINLYTTDLKIPYTTETVIYGAPILLFGGLGLIVAYLIESKARKTDRE